MIRLLALLSVLIVLGACQPKPPRANLIAMHKIDATAITEDPLLKKSVTLGLVSGVPERLPDATLRDALEQSLRTNDLLASSEAEARFNLTAQVNRAVEYLRSDPAMDLKVFYVAEDRDTDQVIFEEIVESEFGFGMLDYWDMGEIKQRLMEGVTKNNIRAFLEKFIRTLEALPEAVPVASSRTEARS